MTILNALLVPLLLISKTTFAAETMCGKILAVDSHYASIDHALLDQPSLQDLLTLRFDKFQGSILLVGKMGAGKSALINALLEKAKSVRIPYARIEKFHLRDGQPFMNMEWAGDVVQFKSGVVAKPLLLEIPEGALVTFDWELRDLLQDQSQQTISFEGNLNVVPLMHVLGMSYAIKTERNAFVLQTMPAEAFEELRKYGSAGLEAYTVIDMDAGELLRWPRAD